MVMRRPIKPKTGCNGAIAHKRSFTNEFLRRPTASVKKPSMIDLEGMESLDESVLGEFVRASGVFVDFETQCGRTGWGSQADL